MLPLSTVEEWRRTIPGTEFKYTTWYALGMIHTTVECKISTRRVTVINCPGVAQNYTGRYYHLPQGTGIQLNNVPGTSEKGRAGELFYGYPRLRGAEGGAVCGSVLPLRSMI